MKKLFLLFVASVLVITGTKAEESSTLVATLNHEGKMLAYYGQDALVKAYNVAREGDVITLSAGRFSTCTMQKNITIRGVGCQADSKSDNGITYLIGAYDTYFNITLQDNEYEFVLEGVYCLGNVSISSSKTSITKEVTLSKCCFNYGVTLANSAYAKVNQCYHWGQATSNNPFTFTMYQGVCQNSIFRKFSGDTGNSPIVLQNCVIYDFRSGWFSIPSSSVLTNCLVIGNGLAFSSASSVHNCVGYDTGIESDFFKYTTNSTNKMVEDRDNFFKHSIVTKSTDQYGDVSGYTVKWDNYSSVEGGGLFELSDEAAKIYKGNDGTVVGVWGGAYPFNITPSNPRLTKCEMVPRVGNDGKLNVTIEVAQ